MNKRTQKEIEMDLRNIREVAKTARSLKELAELSNLSVSKVKTTLSKHPIICKKILATLDVNKNKIIEDIYNTDSSLEPFTKNKEIVICDCPALIHGFKSCKETHIVIPQFVKNTIEAISRSNESAKVQNILTYLENTDACTIIEGYISPYSLIEPKSDANLRSKLLVALACKYWCDGYHVTIKTRTTEVYKLAILQEVLEVVFVQDDDLNTKN